LDWLVEDIERFLPEGSVSSFRIYSTSFARFGSERIRTIE
jgi:hypothetical protein